MTTSGQIHWRRALALGGLAAAGLTAWLMLQPGGAHSALAMSYAGTLAAQAAALAAIAALRQAPVEARVRRFWALVGGAVAAALIGNGIWLFEEAVSGVPTPVPSWADAAHLAGYGLALAALVSYPTQAHDRFSRMRTWLDPLIAAGALAMLAWLSVAQPLLAPGSSLGSAFWAILYPIADLGLLLMLINLWAGSSLWGKHAPLGLVAWGMTAFAVTDLAYSYLALRGHYQTGHPLDAGWMAGYVLVMAGALRQAQGGAPQDNGAPARPPPAWWRRLQLWLPPVATVTLLVYTMLSYYTTGWVEPLAAWACLTLGVALVARQGILAGEAELTLYAHLVSSTATSAFVADDKGMLRLANPALLAALGHGHEGELLGRSMAELFAPGEPLTADDLTLGELLGHSLAGRWSGEVRLQRQDGSSFPAHLSLSGLQSVHAPRPMLAGTVHNLTAQKQQEAALHAAYEQVARAREQLETLNRELEQKVSEKTRSLSEANEQLARQNEALQTLDKLKSEFVSLVSHELRAPLTNIAGGIEAVLTRPAGLPPRAHETLALVQTEIQRLSQLVETILDLSTLDAGHGRFAPAPVKLERVIESVRAQFERQIETRARTPGGRRAAAGLRVKVPADLPFVLADERRLMGVFYNLLDNALKYAPEGEISIEAGSAGGQVLVWVTDQGPGIPPGAREMIFQKFQRLNGGDAQPVYGHGLGLYVVRRLLQAMGGDIRVVDSAGGARFHFWLPAAEEADA